MSPGDFAYLRRQSLDGEPVRELEHDIPIDVRKSRQSAAAIPVPAYLDFRSERAAGHQPDRWGAGSPVVASAALLTMRSAR